MEVVVGRRRTIGEFDEYVGLKSACLQLLDLESRRCLELLQDQLFRFSLRLQSLINVLQEIS